jgi:hypothetical protein
MRPPRNRECTVLTLIAPIADGQFPLGKSEVASLLRCRSITQYQQRFIMGFHAQTLENFDALDLGGSH